MPNDDHKTFVGPDGYIVPPIAKHGLMPHNDGFPWLSRDWKEIDCSAKACKNYGNGRCLIPSVAEIGDDGRCKGFTPSISVPIKKEKQEEIINPIANLEIE
jgi:hypothetical protein